jgi:predicted transcriptional regulator of viral defense system
VKSAHALALLRKLKTRAFTTADAAVCLGQSVAVASHTLGRLRAAGLVTRIRRGLWTTADALEPLSLPEHVVAPNPAYVSLHSALRFHGLIEQIPAVIYAVSLARSQRVKTSVGTYSIHRIDPAFFGGFRLEAEGRIKMATPEKALLDVFYLSGGRSRLFAALPELTLPRGFHFERARAWIRRIPSVRLRTIVSRRLAALEPAGRGSAGGRSAGRRGRGRATARRGR